MVMGMAVTCKNFGSTKEGQEVKLYTMENKNGMIVTVTNLITPPGVATENSSELFVILFSSILLYIF